ncbi:hypothetical protein [Streptomyces sp. NPDC060184]|uniref:hypothetical protein n=1 Tax=Streptomyces sp. NPDC060184 TaxID=3347064 RepID=UPI003663BD49
MRDEIREVTIVAGGPVDAARLVSSEEPGTAIRVLCAEEGSKDERAALEGALAEASRRGCAVRGGPVYAGGAGGSGAPLLRELRGLRPRWVRIADPDPTRVDFDADAGVPVHAEPRRGAAALAALAAVRALQLESGVPVFVECRRDADEDLGAAAGARYPRTAKWLTEGFDGRLTAFLPSAAGVVRWTQAEPGGTGWLGPELLPGPRLMPGLSVVRDPCGFVHLFALRRSARADGGDDVEIVHAVQYRTGRALTPWRSLGTPNPGDRYKSREGGFPAAGFDRAGGLFVFARNFGHSVSFRHQSPDGTWTGWYHLSGLRVADELVAVTTAHGDVELLARTRDTGAVVRWHRTGAEGAWTEDRGVPFTPVPGSMAAGAEPGTVLFRDASTREPAVWWPGAAAPLLLGGGGGDGPPTAVRGVDVDGWTCTVLVGSGPDGRRLVGGYVEGRPDTGVWWSGAGTTAAFSPTAVRARNGALTLAALTADGRLAVAHRTSRSNGLEFGSGYTV